MEAYLNQVLLCMMLLASHINEHEIGIHFLKCNFSLSLQLEFYIYSKAFVFKHLIRFLFKVNCLCSLKKWERLKHLT